MKIKFGTDGVRGKANESLTAQDALAIAQAASEVLGKDGGAKSALIARDTRISGPMFESALSAGLMSRGFDALLCGVMPTPSMGPLIRHYNAGFGIMISASHNPYFDNGIKLFDASGLKLADEVEEEIESLIEAGAQNAGGEFGALRTLEYPENAYLAFLRDKFQAGLNGLRAVIDCSNGAASALAARAYSEQGASVHILHAEPDGFNINADCGSTHPEHMQAETVKVGADIGLAFDGDADRLIASSPDGSAIDGDMLLYIFARYLKKKGLLPSNTIAATVMSNSGLKKSLDSCGIQIEYTNVGDRYVLEAMQKNGYSLGGEQSGHIINMAIGPSGDGMANGLMLMSIMAQEGKGAIELLEGLEILPQATRNAEVADDKKEACLKSPMVSEALAEYTEKYKKNGKLLIRPSGTEPKIRVTVEAESIKEAERDAEFLATLIQKGASEMQ